MGDSLFKISLIVSLTGTLFVLLLANILEPEPVQIKEIDNSYIDCFVKIRGNITDTRNLDNMFIISVEDETGKINAVGYDNADFEKVLNVEIVGKVTEYKGELEIEAAKIKPK